jgi:hypothetical protein
MSKNACVLIFPANEKKQQINTHASRISANLGHPSASTLSSSAAVVAASLSLESSSLESSLLDSPSFSVFKRWKEEEGFRCNVKKSSKINIFYTSMLLTISAQVVLEITRFCVTLEVASKVTIVARAEVLLADFIDVIGVTGACDVYLVPVDELL